MTAWRKEYFECNDGKTQGVRVVDGVGRVICDNERYYPQALEPTDADLIAAAPELLAIARHAFYELRVSDYELGHPLIVMIEVALAKAEPSK